jgi:hypothetical protein
VLRRFEQDAKLRAWLAFLTSYRAVLDRLVDELLEKRGGIEEHFSQHLSDSAAATLEKVLALIAEAAAKPTDAC